MTEKKKIVILEDDENDLIKRYSSFNSLENEVHVYLNSNHFTKELKKAGFTNIHTGLPKKLLSEKFLNEMNTKNRIRQRDLILNEETPVEGDVYYSDGLNGDCFEFLQSLPKEKVKVCSGSGWIIREAHTKGYKLYNPIFGLEK